MAQKVLVQLVDDLDGQVGDDVTTIQFGLDGATYEIDLSGDHAERFREALSPFVESARRIGGRLNRGTKPGTASATADEARRIREWAAANEYDLSPRGRIPRHVVDAYRQAQAQQ